MEREVLLSTEITKPSFFGLALLRGGSLFDFLFVLSILVPPAYTQTHLCKGPS